MSVGFWVVRSSLGRAVCLLALQWGWAGIAAAAYDAARPEGGRAAKPAEVCVVSVASLRELSDTATAMGVELPWCLTARGIEEKISFLRGHGLDPARPIGMMLFTRPGWDLSRGQGVAIVLPVNPETTPAAWFEKIGATPVPDHPDTFDLSGATVRRTKDHLIFATPRDAALAVDPARLVDPYKADATNGASLVHASFDVATMRMASPEQFRDFFHLSASDSADDPIRQFGQESVAQWWQTARRIDLDVRRAGGSLRAKITFDPFAFPSPEREFTLPGMPADVMARIDLAIPPATFRLLGDPWSNGKPADPREAKARTDLLHEGIELFLSGKAWSIGISPNPRGLPAYFVEQQVEGSARDRIRRFADRYNALNQLWDPAHRGIAKVESYMDDGLMVHRVKVVASDHHEAYVDAAERGHNLYLTFSHDPGHYLKPLVGRPPEGKMTGAFDMRMNMERAMEAVLTMPNGQIKNLPAEQREQLGRILKGQTIDCTIAAEDKCMAVEISLPETLLRRLSEAMVEQR